MTEKEIDALASVIWNYMRLEMPLRKAEIIFVPCSFDTRVATYAAKLYNEGYGEYLVFSGNGKGRITEQLFDGVPEAEVFAAVALKKGVPPEKIIIEDQATHSGENIIFTHRLLDERHLHPQSVILVQKPYMARRAYATFLKQWPDATVDISVTSPPIPLEKYYNQICNRELVLNAMVGDLQRLKLYGEQGMLVSQAIPEKVWDAYRQLVAAGYDKRIILS